MNFDRLCDSRGLTIAALVVLAVALVLRVINLDADPSALLNRDFITDEGWWAHNARNAFFHGHWRIDEYNLGLYSAYLYNVLLYAIIKVLGVSLISIRLLPAVAGWGTVVLLFDLVRRQLNFRAAVLASVLLGFSNLHIIYSRIGFAESTMVFFLALMLWLWRQRRTRFGFALLSGASFALMLVTKVTAIYFAPGFALLILVEAIRRTTKLREALLFLSGVVLVGASYGVFFVLPSFRDWLSFNVANGSGSEWSTGSLTLAYSTLRLLGASFYAKAPIATALSLLALCALTMSISREGFKKAIRDAGELELTSAMLLFGYLVSLALTLYQPERRFLPGLFLMVILSAGLLERGWGWLEEVGAAGYRMGAAGWFAVLFFLPAVGILELRTAAPPGRVWLFKILAIAGLIALAWSIARETAPRRLASKLLAASKVIFFLLFSFLSLSLLYKSLMLWGMDLAGLGSADNIGKLRTLLVVLAAVAACTELVYGILGRRRWRSIWLIGAFLFVEGAQVSTWLMQPTYSLREANAALAESLTQDDTVVTYYETVLVSTEARVICRSLRRGFNVDAFEKFKPQYILVLRRDNWKEYALEEMPVEEWPPPREYEPEKVAAFELCPTRLGGPRFVAELYRLSPRSRRQRKSQKDESPGVTR